ncbi:hypothetical protein A3D83_02755 [Candidatus Daviesbacteria bacterium RIFCSPHIGHO2_02_FULL_41_10]|uniref:Glycosyltransferase 2-like domain-containing protein n=2 Tax=Candidatus Daviesiibacteriota TaxID=1752718 RepID=A0A1F5IQY7_9BACT|nr:MAG: hypothetical protein A2871_02095 [Candidatus Daviesbacteria bacterium RIFCSPHIGHO2_01_FULL_41_23]OGE33048.1 MAG: hypothetical protein A3D83_02755 [Candidatus Daviesbacteria bacterium RIFCSPHIGHO2_02_FULL_41_10]
MRNFEHKLIINLAIIIPTLNEEHFIGRLLDSIIKQSVAPEEIVVVDASSKDRTIAEIKKRQKKLSNLRFFKVPKNTVSRQRNLGARQTTCPHLLFLDADMELRERNSLEEYFTEVLNKQPDLAAAQNLPDSDTRKDLIYFKAENLLFKFLKHFWPVITARNLYVTRKMFNKVGGFDEEIPVGEDLDLVQRIVKEGGKLILLISVKLYTSTRRVELEGRRKYALRMILFGLSILLQGHKKSKIKYEFGKFKKSTVKV